MQELKIQIAGEVFDKTEFIDSEDWRTYPTADYRCSDCGMMVTINFSDLEKHSLSEFTNLNVEDQQVIKKLEANNLSTNSFLDFYCPGCHRPVKVYYDFWAGGRFEAGFSIKYVIH